MASLLGLFQRGLFQPTVYQIGRLDSDAFLPSKADLARIKKKNKAEEQALRRKKEYEEARQLEIETSYEALIPRPPEPPRPVILKRAPVEQVYAPAPQIDFAAVAQARAMALEEDDIEVLLLAA